ncbi:MAG: hypothetical protein ACK4S4_07665 [Pyrinomonadaceae bacterium]
MSERSNSAGTLRAFLVVLATIGTIAFNALAAAGYVNGVTPEMISGKYPTVVTPAGYAFSIWSLIYTGLIAFSIYQLLPGNRERLAGLRSPYILTAALNCGWIYFWHNDQILAAFGVIVALCLTLVYICGKVATTVSLGEYWAVKAPFSIYAGWVTCASLVNLAIMLVYLRVDLSASAANAIGVVFILLAALFAVAARAFLRNDLYPLAVAWALTAIAIKQSGNTPIVVAAVVGVIAALIATLSFVVKMPPAEARQS